MPISDPHAAAAILYEARRTAIPVEPFTDNDPGLDLADGYVVQQHLVRMLLADGERIAGYKVGLTSRPMQQMAGAGSPDYGPVLASTVYPSGAQVPMSRFIQPRIEAEIAFVLGERLEGPGISVADASRATAGVAASMEIIDSRIVGWRVKLADTVADLAAGGAAVLSSRIVPLAGLDTRLIGVMLTRSGELAGTGAGAAALGDPLTALAWLANTLGEHGIALEPGQLVMTGSMHAAVPMAAGDVFRADFDRLGPVTVRVTETE